MNFTKTKGKTVNIDADIDIDGTKNILHDFNAYVPVIYKKASDYRRIFVPDVPESDASDDKAFLNVLKHYPLPQRLSSEMLANYSHGLVQEKLDETIDITDFRFKKIQDISDRIRTINSSLSLIEIKDILSKFELLLFTLLNDVNIFKLFISKLSVSQKTSQTDNFKISQYALNNLKLSVLHNPSEVLKVARLAPNKRTNVNHLAQFMFYITTLIIAQSLPKGLKIVKATRLNVKTSSNLAPVTHIGYLDKRALQLTYNIKGRVYNIITTKKQNSSYKVCQHVRTCSRTSRLKSNVHSHAQDSIDSRINWTRFILEPDSDEKSKIKEQLRIQSDLLRCNARSHLVQHPISSTREALFCTPLGLKNAELISHLKERNKTQKYDIELSHEKLAQEATGRVPDANSTMLPKALRTAQILYSINKPIELDVSNMAGQAINFFYMYNSQDIQLALNLTKKQTELFNSFAKQTKDETREMILNHLNNTGTCASKYTITDVKSIHLNALHSHKTYRNMLPRAYVNYIETIEKYMSTFDDLLPRDIISSKQNKVQGLRQISRTNIDMLKYKVKRLERLETLLKEADKDSDKDKDIKIKKELQQSRKELLQEERRYNNLTLENITGKDYLGLIYRSIEPFVMLSLETKNSRSIFDAVVVPEEYLEQALEAAHLVEDKFKAYDVSIEFKTSDICSCSLQREVDIFTTSRTSRTSRTPATPATPRIKAPVNFYQSEEALNVIKQLRRLIN